MLVPLLLAGCYTYTPVEPSIAPAGSDVRVRVTRGVPLEVGMLPVEQDGGLLRGRLLEGAPPDTLLCSVALASPVDGATDRRLRGTVTIPVEAVETLEVRRLDRVRTGVLVGASAVIAAVLVDAAFDIRGGKEGTDDPGGVDNARITWFRLRW
ncbi:MAG TPA: hypothetical protein VK849_03885 [Longimicrobiales bacterium]|nr:hypothetical protein [Longimicrobiales bacterium]